MARKDQNVDIDVYAFSTKTQDTFNVLSSPYWVLVFILLTTPFFVISSVVLSNLELTTWTPEQKYAVAAIVGGLTSDLFIRRYLRVALVLLRNPRLPFIVLWLALCGLVIGFEPARKVVEAIF